ncbi:MAG: apolipoprotein N-acyltransferase [Bacteroidales bacterium]|nr:apolipoprotein N-acyltransferase [Bacteroidales bacterium]
MKWYRILLISLLGGLLLGVSWYPHGLPFLVFFGLIPFFFVSDRLLENGSKVAFWKGFIFSYLGFVVWNAITTYWVSYVTIPGGLFAVFVNALLMALVFALWHASRKWVPQRWLHPILFAAFWISFEYLHLNWELTWPWLNIGNVFAVCPQMVQWYSVTGALGGTLWVIVVNFLLYYLIKAVVAKNRKKIWTFAVSSFLLLFLPMLISGIQYKSCLKHIDTSTPVSVVVVQPNTDNFEEEFVMTNLEHAQRVDSLIAPLLSDGTNLVLCPEDVFPHTVSLQSMVTNQLPPSPSAYGCFVWMDSLMKVYPQLNFLLGLSTFEILDHPTHTSTQLSKHVYGEHYNTAMCFDKDGYNGHYHKCRLVPGSEAFPYRHVFGFLADLMIELGGYNGTLGRDTAQKVFTIEVDGKPLKVGTAICYESIYGDLVRKFVKNGAQLLTVITNDSWWGDSPGHFQHYEMSRLRAVENRRYVVRSANGGNSAVISPTGDALTVTDYNTRTAWKTVVGAQNHITFYTKHGDYIAKTAVCLMALGLLWMLIQMVATIVSRRRT